MTVTLTKITETILSNFSTINSSIVFKAGNTVRTISNAGTFLLSLLVRKHGLLTLQYMI